MRLKCVLALTTKDAVYLLSTVDVLGLFSSTPLEVPELLWGSMEHQIFMTDQSSIPVV